jgi:hypothetical protein
MSISDFLFEGQAPTPVTLTGQTSVQLPEWYTQYTTDMLGRAQAVAGQPYQTFPGPRIAPFTPTEQAGMGMTQQAATAYQPFVQSAGELFGKAGGMMAGHTAAPFIGEAAGMTRAAAGASALPLAQQYLGAGIQAGGLQAAQPFISGAAQLSAAGAAAPGLQRAGETITRAGESTAVPLAQRYIESGLGVSPIAAAQPYMAGAAKSFPDAAGAYMSPYTENVVNRIADLGVRQLQEKFLPQIGEEFTRAGQFGGSRMGEFAARASRDVQEAVLGEQAKALESGYRTAADIFGADVGRQAQLAGVAGDIARAQQQAMLTAGTQLGQLSQDDLTRLLQSGVQLSDIAKTTGQLTTADAEVLSRLGATTGALGTEQQRALLDVGRQVAGIQESDLARAMTGAGQLGELGLAAGRLTGEDRAALMDLAGRYGELGGEAQRLGLAGAEAVTGVGARERAMQQANLELAYKDFLEQRGYPAEQTEFLSKMLSGVQLPQVTVQQEQQLPRDFEYSSGLQELAGGAASVNEILKLLGGKDSSVSDLLKKLFG